VVVPEHAGALKHLSDASVSNELGPEHIAERLHEIHKMTRHIDMDDLAGFAAHPDSAEYEHIGGALGSLAGGFAKAAAAATKGAVKGAVALGKATGKVAVAASKTAVTAGKAAGKVAVATGKVVSKAVVAAEKAAAKAVVAAENAAAKGAAAVEKAVVSTGRAFAKSPSTSVPNTELLDPFQSTPMHDTEAAKKAIEWYQGGSAPVQPPR